MEESVNQRFNLSSKELIREGYAASKKEIAEKLGVTPQYFTELVKGRIKLSLDFIKKYTNEFPVNMYYLIGDSDVILRGESSSYRASSIISEPSGSYGNATDRSDKDLKRGINERQNLSQTSDICSKCSDKERIIALQNDYLSSLKESLSILKDRIDDLESKRQ